MSPQRYKEIKDRNKDNNLMLCYEVFCEQKPQIPLQQFQELFPQWLIQRDLQTFMKYNGSTDKCMEEVIKYLDNKHV